MRKIITAILLLGISCVCLWGCGGSQDEIFVEPTPPAVPNVKIKVIDVSNDTGKLFDVDVIGLLWSSLEETLKKRDMLWTGPPQSAPMVLEAEILKYQKGSAYLRPILPRWGKTVLLVKSELKNGNQIIAAVEAQHEITFGNGTFTRGAWRKIFKEVAVDLVDQIVAALK